MKKLVSIISVLLSLCILSFDGKAQESHATLRVGIIADIQYADYDARGSRFYRNSLNKLDSCIANFNQEGVDFIINLGDLVDRTPKDIPPVINILAKSDSPVYNLTGNHDYNEIKRIKNCIKCLGCRRNIMSFTRRTGNL